MCWEYVLIYVENLMVGLLHASSVMETISYAYTLKEDKNMKKCFRPPNMYLGTKIQKCKDKDADDNKYWFLMSVNHYVKNIVANI